MQYLLINQTAPFDGNTAQEILDLALALSTFEQNVQLLFLGDGIFQLLKNQQPNFIYRKDFIATFKALAMYDVADVYVDAASLNARRISKNDLVIDVMLVSAEDIVEIMDAVDVVLNMG